MQAGEISRSALDVEWQRLEVIAQNIANANTVRTATGGVYRPLRLMSGPAANFGQYLDGQTVAGQGDPRAPTGVMVYGVEPTDAPPRRVYEPANPQADSQGFVTYPGFDQASEMTLMVKTARVYEANVVALNAGREMYAKALELGKQS
jgi:flagellar basal-body rod protein FlgC